MPFLEVLTVEGMVIKGKRSKAFYVVTGRLNEEYFADVVEIKGDELILGRTLERIRRS
jgi:hypothetical protein